MDIKLPIKIHNRFDIEVKNIITGEIVQKGYAENIVLNSYFTSTEVLKNGQGFHWSIHYGSGTGILSPARTTLFTFVGKKETSLVEAIYNQAPIESYATKKIIILPSEHIGATFSEVGIGGFFSLNDLFTHALIKDSEGNTLVLGPKTDTQEITIYSTVFFQPILEDGISLLFSSNINSLASGFMGTGGVTFRSGTPTPKIYTVFNDNPFYDAAVTQISAGNVRTPKVRFGTNEANNKIKEFNYSGGATNNTAFKIEVETLAENASTMWSGWEFDNTPIGTGDGSQTVFNLTWDEAWLTKPYAVYVDNILQSSGVTFNAGNITFDTAPTDQAVITADYWVKYIPKDNNHVLDVQFTITYGEGSAS